MGTRIGVTLLAVLSAWGVGIAQAEDLPELNIDISQTTVSGISSGAFMAVQMGVVKSASIRGVAATAGGPYFCALNDSFGGAGSTVAIARCMQGDPALGTRPIRPSDLRQMEQAARTWSEEGRIDPVSNLANQSLWVFHGYNDGIVKLPVSEALMAWYARFTSPTQIFHKDTLNAAHAQISASCTDSSCNPCATSGGKFINACQDQPAANGQLYDAAGSALQWFYGPLQRTASNALSSAPQAFSQLPFLKQRNGEPVSHSQQISMGETGYVYVPKSCQTGKQSCRLHIAFHGCMQSATTLGTDFVTQAGVNEWADANNIVVLYPQAMPSEKLPPYPFNPKGCWDWWGYNDTQDMTTLGARAGTYATKDGVQIAAVWRMVEKLTSKYRPSPAPAAAKTTKLIVADHSSNQVVLRWLPVQGASSYQVIRSGNGQTNTVVGSLVKGVSFVDREVIEQTAYSYVVRPMINTQLGAPSNSVNVTLARKPPACDPYFSMLQNSPVTALNIPTTATCP